MFLIKTFFIDFFFKVFFWGGGCLNCHFRFTGLCFVFSIFLIYIFFNVKFLFRMHEYVCCLSFEAKIFNAFFFSFLFLSFFPLSHLLFFIIIVTMNYLID